MEGSGGAERAYIGVGSNIDPERNVPAALELLAGRVRLTAISTFYRTAALDRPGHPDFLNGVCRVVAEGSARDLKFGVLRPIEDELGRVRREDAWAPRTIDLDLLIFGRLVARKEGLTVPDPDLRSRPFLAVPVLELEPELVLPDTGERLADVAPEAPTGSMEPQPDLTRELRERLLR